MSTRLNPYLAFRGEAGAAIDFYQSVLGGQVTRTTFAESHMDVPADEASHLMHSMLETPGGITLMAADIPSSMELTSGSTISVSLSGDDEAELRGYFDGLSAGGTVTVPMEKAPWGDTFGMLTDKFGVDWMVNAQGSPGDGEDEPE